MNAGTRLVCTRIEAFLAFRHRHATSGGFLKTNGDCPSNLLELVPVLVIIYANGK